MPTEDSIEAEFSKKKDEAFQESQLIANVSHEIRNSIEWYRWFFGFT